MTIYLFEDNEEYILSKFIKCAYTQDEQKHLGFAKGNRNVKQKLKEIYKEFNKYIVYLDVIPDNPNTMTEYLGIQDWLTANNIQNVTVLPIPSIEYYFIKELGDLSVPEVKVALTTADYKNTGLVIKKLNGVCDSYENYCKAVLNFETDLCKRPMTKSKNLTAHQYYLRDCFCEEPYIKCTDSKSLTEKA